MARERECSPMKLGALHSGQIIDDPCRASSERIGQQGGTYEDRVSVLPRVVAAIIDLAQRFHGRVVRITLISGPESKIETWATPRQHSAAPARAGGTTVDRFACASQIATGARPG